MLRLFFSWILIVVLSGCGEKPGVVVTADAATVSQSELQAQEAEAKLRIIRAEVESKLIQDAARAEEEKQENASLAKKLAESAGRKIMGQAGGGQDYRVKIINWEYDKPNDQFEIKIETYWNGKFFRSNDYEVDGIIKCKRDGSGANFARTYVNSNFESAEENMNWLEGTLALGMLLGASSSE